MNPLFLSKEDLAEIELFAAEAEFLRATEALEEATLAADKANRRMEAALQAFEEVPSDD